MDALSVNNLLRDFVLNPRPHRQVNALTCGFRLVKVFLQPHTVNASYRLANDKFLRNGVKPHSQNCLTTLQKLSVNLEKIHHMLNNLTFSSSAVGSITIESSVSTAHVIEAAKPDNGMPALINANIELLIAADNTYPEGKHAYIKLLQYIRSHRQKEPE